MQPTIYFVSLGWNCYTSKLFRNFFRFNIAASPFDWNQSLSGNSVCDLLENHFSGFLDDHNLEFPHESVQYTKNKSCHFYFCHDLDLKTKTFDKEKFKEKYKRRIDRMYSCIDAADVVCFVRSGSGFSYDLDKNTIYFSPDSQEGWLKSLGGFEGDQGCEEILRKRIPQIFGNKQHIELVYLNGMSDVEYIQKLKNQYKCWETPNYLTVDNKTPDGGLAS
jgi:hypothetical protein